MQCHFLSIPMYACTNWRQHFLAKCYVTFFPSPSPYVCKHQFEQTTIVGRSKQELSQTQIIPSSSGPTNTWQGSKGSTFDSMWVAEADGFFLANFQCLVVAHISTPTIKEELFANSYNTDVKNQHRKRILHQLHDFYICKCHRLNFQPFKSLFHLFVVFWHICCC